VIATITLNPCLDASITVHGLVIDEANRWTSSHVYPGGKGVDVSRAIHEMGGRTTAYGFIGGALGRRVEILLDEEEVPFSFTPIDDETRTNFIITDTKTHQQTRIDAPGPRISRKEFERFHRKIKQIYPKPNLVVVGGSVPPGVPYNVYYDMITEAKDLGVRCLLDAEGKWLEEGLKAKPYLIKPNIRETEALLQRRLFTEEDIIKAARDLLKTGVKIAVISRGKAGLIAASKESIIKVVPPEVKVKSAVGAGDCAIAGLALKLVHDEPLIEACRLGVAMGTAAVLTPGTELCHRAEVERLLPEVEVREIPAKPRAKAASFANT